MHTNILGQNRGQALLETLVALGAAVFIIAAITVSVLSSLNNAETSEAQSIASKYAAEGMEIVRNLRDQNASFITDAVKPVTYCLGSETSKLGTPTPKKDCTLQCGQNVQNKGNTSYIRQVCIETDDDMCKATSTTRKVTVAVWWSDGKCTDASNPFCHKSQTVSCLGAR